MSSSSEFSAFSPDSEKSVDDSDSSSSGLSSKSMRASSCALAAASSANISSVASGLKLLGVSRVGTARLSKAVLCVVGAAEALPGVARASRAESTVGASVNLSKCERTLPSLGST